MNPSEFKKMLSVFASTPADVEISRGVLTAQIFEEIIEAKIEHVSHRDELYVIENNRKMEALSWFFTRIAKLPQLADRILVSSIEPAHFVEPKGWLKDDSISQNYDIDHQVPNVLACLSKGLSTPIAGTSSVFYLTSDAGEGKTTLIHKLARDQASKFKRKESNWLLLPIPLGGKAFIRFDDAIITALMKNLRFPYYFFDGVIELIKRGVIVPAFDGFEEMFVEGSSSEVVSSLGSLLDSLESSGNVLLATRKAFFEYISLDTQAKLFDSIGNKSVLFSRVKLERWTKEEFLEYGQKRNCSEVEGIYEILESRFGPDHPLLRRAVLVKRIFDVVESKSNAEDFARILGEETSGYFFNFVNTIVLREANEKWLSKGGDVKYPLLTAQEHHELLSMLAKEMWLSKNIALRGDLLDVISDLYCERIKKKPTDSRQIRERLRQHSMLAIEDSRALSYRFDHDDFRKFYLGEALGESLVKLDINEIREFLSIDQVGNEIAEHALAYFRRNAGDSFGLLSRVIQIAEKESLLSFVSENCGCIIIKLLNKIEMTPEHADFKIKGITFGSDILQNIEIHEIRFIECHFQSTKLTQTKIMECSFEHCKFDRIDLPSEKVFSRTNFINCKIHGLVLEEDDLQIFSPHDIKKQLENSGCDFLDKEEGLEFKSIETDPRLLLLQRFLRVFYRKTYCDESIIKVKLGKQSNEFLDDLLPRLLREQIVSEHKYRGSGQQRLFSLVCQMQDIQNALATCEGNFDDFISSLKQ